MSNSKDIVIIKTWDDQIFEIDVNIEQWLKAVENLQNQGKKKIFLEKYKESLYFANIKSERGKTQYLAIEAPKQKERLYTDEEIQISKQNKQEALKRLFERRKKEFPSIREKILRDLAKREEEYGMETTVRKLRDLEQFKKIKIQELGKK